MLMTFTYGCAALSCCIDKTSIHVHIYSILNNMILDKKYTSMNISQRVIGILKVYMVVIYVIYTLRFIGQHKINDTMIK